MPEYLDFLPLFPTEDEATIRTRWEGWANEGKTVDQVDVWTDVRPGSFWYVATSGGIREAARVYDLMSEVAASAFPLWTWGSYLDDKSEEVDIARLAAVPATGVVTFSGTAGTLIPAGTLVSVEPTEPDGDVPEYETDIAGNVGGGGTVDLAVTAVEPGAEGNVGIAAVTVLLNPIANVTGVTNAAPISGGADEETDEALRERLLEEYRAQGPGTQTDYVRWARAYSASIGRVTVLPLWNGPGTVKVVITDRDGQPLPAGTVTGLQTFLDPIPQQGAGLAPPGALVTVETATALPIDVTATVELEPGHSLDGAAGTVDVSAAIEAALRGYLVTVPPGGEVVHRRLIGEIVTVSGVHDASVTVPAANVAVDDDPAEVPFLDDLVLGEGAL